MAEKEYIDRQSTVDALARLCKRVCQYSEKQRQFMCGACPLGDAFTVIEDDLPAADVRPVVVCWDCKHWDVDWVPNYAKENEHFCPIVALTTRDDWFCADGEKREES